MTIFLYKMICLCRTEEIKGYTSGGHGNDKGTLIFAELFRVLTTNIEFNVVHITIDCERFFRLFVLVMS